MLRWIAENDEEAQAPAAAPPPERVSSGEESDAIKNLRVEAARLQAENQELQRRLTLSQGQCTHLAGRAKELQVSYRRSKDMEEMEAVAHVLRSEAQAAYIANECNQEVYAANCNAVSTNQALRGQLNSFEQSAYEEINRLLSDFQNSTMREESLEEQL